jgi:hypothetical protein
LQIFWQHHLKVDRWSLAVPVGKLTINSQVRIISKIQNQVVYENMSAYFESKQSFF